MGGVLSYFTPEVDQSSSSDNKLNVVQGLNDVVFLDTCSGYPQKVVCLLKNLRNVDIVVNSTDRSLDLSAGGEISKAIKRYGGSQIQAELNRCYTGGIEPGRIAVTGGYYLPYRYVFHCSLQNISERISHHLIREIIYECLEKVKTGYPYSSIAFPGIGTGSMNFPPGVLHTIYCTILEFMIKNPNKVKNAYILVHPAQTELIDYLKNINRDVQKARLTYPVSLPSTWSQSERICRIKLNEWDNEYKDAVKKFDDTIGRKFKIIKIERIENKRLYVAYKRYQNQLPAGRNQELHVWHGTQQGSIDNIIRYGFDWRLTERAAYGQGCYFAVKASYSDNDRYSAPNGNKEKHMFLCNIVVGEYIAGNSSIDEKNISSNIQATVDDVNNPSIFVTYNDDQMYPAYLIVYKHA